MIGEDLSNSVLWRTTVYFPLFLGAWMQVRPSGSPPRVGNSLIEIGLGKSRSALAQSVSETVRIRPRESSKTVQLAISRSVALNRRNHPPRLSRQLALQPIFPVLSSAENGLDGRCSTRGGREDSGFRLDAVPRAAAAAGSAQHDLLVAKSLDRLVRRSLP